MLPVLAVLSNNTRKLSNVDNIYGSRVHNLSFSKVTDKTRYNDEKMNPKNEDLMVSNAYLLLKNEYHFNMEKLIFDNNEHNYYLEKC